MTVQISFVLHVLLRSLYELLYKEKHKKIKINFIYKILNKFKKEHLMKMIIAKKEQHHEQLKELKNLNSTLKTISELSKTIIEMLMNINY